MYVPQKQLGARSHRVAAWALEKEETPQAGGQMCLRAADGSGADASCITHLFQLLPCSTMIEC
jgi:hypothetical protein